MKAAPEKPIGPNKIHIERKGFLRQRTGKKKKTKIQDDQKLRETENT